MKRKISFIGLGKLGLPLATCFAKNKIDVLAIDKDKELIKLLSNNVCPWYEANLQDNINKSSGFIEYTDSYENIIDKTDVSIILVNTQIGQSYSSIAVDGAIKDICDQLKSSSKDYHLFILSSTVMPTEIEERFIPSIEMQTGRKINEGFGFAYVPDFVKLGSVIHNFEHPDVLIIGGSNEKSQITAEELYLSIFQTKIPPIHKMSLVEAELAKISSNAYLVNKISFANFLSNICERTPNANVDNITNAIGNDVRISPYFLKGGLSFGGTCFPRDTWAFIEYSKKIGLNASQLIATDNINKYQDYNLFTIVNSFNTDIVGVLGLSFKPKTTVLEESASVKLITSLLLSGKKVVVYDPIFPPDKSPFNEKVTFVDNIEKCVKMSPAVVVALPYPEFRRIEDSWKNFDKHIILDCWRILNRDRFKEMEYKCLGEKIINSYT